MCTPLDDLPAEGFWDGAVYSLNPDAQGRARSFAIGVVRRPVTRVAITTPTETVDATLAPLEDGIGTLYWAPAPGPTPDPNTRRTVYRGTTPVFSCRGTHCVTAPI